jgi:diguanylate cyclase (GGDEF)-like protein
MVNMASSTDLQAIEQEIQQTVDLKTKVKLALDLSDLLQDSQTKVSHQWVLQAFKWIEEDGDLIAEEGRGLMLLGNILLRQGYFDQAQKKYEQALEIARKLDQPWLLCHTLCGLGGAYIGQDLYGLAMEILIQSQNLARMVEDENLTGKILVNLGILYFYLNELEEASRYFKEGADTFERIQNSTRQGMALINLMHTTFAAGDYQQTLDYLAQIRALNQNEPFVEMHSYLVKGAYAANQGNHQEAQEYFERGLVIAQAEEFQNGKIELLFEKTRSLLALNQPQQALKCVQECYAFLDGSQNKLDLRVCHELFSMIYEQSGKYQESLFHYRKFHQMDSEINSELTANRLRSNEALYRAETARKESELFQMKNLQLEREIVERRKLEEALRTSEELYRRQAQLDPLTGVTNRRFFYEIALSEIEKAHHYHLPLATILFDLDHFKNVNDTYGHLTGDMVLKICATRVTESVREMDVVCRYGGEEFIILLPGASPIQTRAIAKRLFDSVSNSPCKVNDQLIDINISVGMANLQAGDTLDDLIEHADQAMYVAKNAGRNRIIEWDQGKFLPVSP